MSLLPPYEAGSEESKSLTSLKLKLLQKIEQCLVPWSVMNNGGADFLKTAGRTKTTSSFLAAHAKLHDEVACSSQEEHEKYVMWAVSLDQVIAFIDEQHSWYQQQAQRVAQELPLICHCHGEANSAWRPSTKIMEGRIVRNKHSRAAQKHLLKKEVATDITKAFANLSKELGLFGVIWGHHREAILCCFVNIAHTKCRVLRVCVLGRSCQHCVSGESA